MAYDKAEVLTMEAYYHFKLFPSSQLRPEQVEYIKYKMKMKLVRGQSI